MSFNRAGKESDVYVVPNLNIMYEEVSLVYWNNSTCSADLDSDDEFPSSFVINPEDGKNALTFYSRFHIEQVKLPEIFDAMNAINQITKRIENDEKICCGKPAGGSCLGEKTGNDLKSCNAKDKEEILEKFAFLDSAAEDWVRALDDADRNVDRAIETQASVVNWFDTIGREDMYTKDDKPGNEGDGGSVTIQDFKAPLAPLTLIDMAKATDPTQEDGKQKIFDTNRIQFNGKAGTYELELSKAKLTSLSEQDCTESKALQWLSAVMGFLGDPLGTIVDTVLTKQTYDKEKAKRQQQTQAQANFKKVMDASGASKGLAGEDREKYDKMRQEYSKVIKQLDEEKKELKKTEIKEDSKKLNELKKQPTEGGVKKQIAALEKQIAENKKNDQSPAEEREDKENTKKKEALKREQKGSDDRIKAKTQSNAAQSAAKGQSNGKGGLAGGLSKIMLPIQGAIFLTTATASGCNYKMTTGTDPGEVELEASFFGVGFGAKLSSGKERSVLYLFAI